MAFVLDEEFVLAPQRRSQRLMGGHMQQQTTNAATTALYDGALNNAGPGNEAGDAVMARWLQSAGLQHLGSPVASAGVDQRHLPNLLMQVLTNLHMLYMVCLACPIISSICCVDMAYIILS